MLRTRRGLLETIPHRDVPPHPIGLRARDHPCSRAPDSDDPPGLYAAGLLCLVLSRPPLGQTQRLMELVLDVGEALEGFTMGRVDPTHAAPNL